MVTLGHDLRFGRSILWGTVGVLVVRLLMAIPVAAQSPGQQPSAPVNPTQALAEYQEELETNPQSSLATTISQSCFLVSAGSSRARTPAEMRCGATGFQAGPRSGATSN